MHNINAQLKTDTEASNKKIEIQFAPVIRPHLSEGVITYSVDGVCPPLNFCHFDLRDISFHDLPFVSSCGHFDHADLRSCSFIEGDLHASSLEKAKLQGNISISDAHLIWKKIEFNSSRPSLPPSLDLLPGSSATDADCGADAQTEQTTVTRL
jgi:hypothetical protein